MGFNRRSIGLRSVMKHVGTPCRFERSRRPFCSVKLFLGILGMIHSRFGMYDQRILDAERFYFFETTRLYSMRSA
jgi:hypothetical protein